MTNKFQEVSASKSIHDLDDLTLFGIFDFLNKEALLNCATVCKR